MRLKLVLVLLAAAALRVVGIDFGLPLELRPDEEVFRQVVRRMIEAEDLNPHRFEYGGPLFYTLYGATWVVHAAARLVDEAGAGTLAAFASRTTAMALIQRSLSALLGVATVLLVYGIGRRLHSAAAGLAAAALLAAMFLPVRDSHFGTVDIAAAFAATWALLLIVRAGQSGRLRAFAAAGAVAGLATAIRYVPCVLFLPLWITAWRAERVAGRRMLSAAFGPRVFLAGSTMVVGFLVLAPYTILAFEEFSRSFLNAFLAGGDAAFNLVARLRELVAVALVRAVDWPFAVAGIVALIAGLFGRNPPARAVALFVVAYTAALSSGTNFYLRWLNPVIPALCVLVGVLLARLTRGLKRGPLWFALGIAALAALPAVRSVRLDLLFLRESTFQQAARWLRDLPAGAVVSCPHQSVTQALGASSRFVLWDPRGFRSRAEWYAVVPRYPGFGIGPDPAWTSYVLPAEGEVTRIAHFEGPNPANWDGAVFEKTDLFYYPLGGFDAVLAAGPDFDILRIVPRRPDSASTRSLPPPPTLTVSEHAGKLRLAFSAPEGVDPLGYYLHLSAGGDPGSAVLLGSYYVGPGGVDLPFSRHVAGGRFLIASATVARNGLGPWSDPVVVAIE